MTEDDIRRIIREEQERGRLIEESLKRTFMFQSNEYLMDVLTSVHLGSSDREEFSLRAQKMAKDKQQERARLESITLEKLREEASK